MVAEGGEKSFFSVLLALGKFLLGVTASRAWHYLGLASVRSLAALLVDTNGSLTTRNSINTEAEPPLKNHCFTCLSIVPKPSPSSLLSTLPPSFTHCFTQPLPQHLKCPANSGISI